VSTLLQVLLAACLALSIAGPLRAHDPGLSELEISLDAGRVEASWWIDPADLLEREPAPRGALRLTLDGAGAEPALAEARTTWDGHRELRFVWSAAPREALRITASLLEQLPLGHRVLARVVEPDGRTGAERLLSARSPSLEHHVARP
jgi:hypothetical protein